MDFDVDTAKQAIDIAKQGATTLNTAVGAVDRLKALFKSPEAPPMEEVRETITGLREQIMSAREANITLRETIGDLRDEMIELKRRQEKFAGYELWNTPCGSVVYRSAEGVEPVHHLCPSCHDAGVKTVLQGNQYVKECRATPSHGSFQFEPRGSIQRRVHGKRRY
ncbi:hypothetical protein RA20_19185 [Leisingera sp. ANG-Vp]|nr:hypothetical protein RA20_19185 [Leisingera sp. ANG-Vp]